jgi:purine nucleosidase/pyrimidine-specific ribonucleoside hydrolase
MTTDRRPLLVFTDPGLDDALALIWLLEQSEIEVIGLVPVAGNQSALQSEKNATLLLRKMGRVDIPIYSTREVSQKHDRLSRIHGHDGLGDYFSERQKELSPEADNRRISDFRISQKHIPFEILSIGSCTAAALFLGTHLPVVHQITIMGGVWNTEGNYEGDGEFNFSLDHGAASQLLSSSLPMSVVPLDVTRSVSFEPSEQVVEQTRNTRATDLFNALAQRYADLAKDRQSVPYPHDLTAASSLLHPDLFDWKEGDLQLNGSRLRFGSGATDTCAFDKRLATGLTTSSDTVLRTILKDLP